MTENNRKKKRRFAFTPTARDEAIFTDLYFARILVTEQIAARFWPRAGSVYFPSLDRASADPGLKGGKRDGSRLLPMSPSVSSALRRLQKLREEQLLVSRDHTRPGGKPTRMWMLSKAAFRREAKGLGHHDEPYPGWPKKRADGSPGKLDHLLDTNDLYVAVAGELDDVLGPHPAWEWREERLASENYKRSWESKTRRHQPDAEVDFRGRLFFVERQTRRAKETYEAIAEKVEAHARRADFVGARASAKIVFACDEKRDVGYALEAARAGGPPLFAGTVDEAAVALAEEAQELSQELSQERARGATA